LGFYLRVFSSEGFNVGEHWFRQRCCGEHS
jgi:hypothetical protein